MAYADAVVLAVKDITRSRMSVDEYCVTPEATNGNKFLNDGRTWVFVRNGSGGDITATFNTPGSVDGAALAELAVTVKATGDGNGLDEMLIGPFTGIYNQSDGYVWVVCSAVTDVLIGAFRLSL